MDWDLPAVLAACDKAEAALSNGRDARAAELWGRAVTSAQALRQPDCLVVAYLQCMQCRAHLLAVTLEDKEHKGDARTTTPLAAEHFKALHMVTNDIPGGRTAIAAAAPKRLSGHVPLLDVQIPALLRLVNSPGAEQVLPPLALATAITANVASVWPRLRAAGLLRPTSTSVLPTYYITVAIELVHCLGMEREPMLVKPLRAMLRELPPVVTVSDGLRSVLQMCHHLVRE